MYFKKDGNQLLLANLRRFIICTSDKVGNRGNKLNNKLNKKQKSKKNIAPSGSKLVGLGPIIKNLSQFKFVLLLGLVLVTLNNDESLFEVPKAQAAFDLTNNLSIARNVVQNIVPQVETPKQTDSLVTSPVPDGYLGKPLVAETNVTKTEVPKKISLAKKTITTNTIAKTAVKVSTGAHYFPYGYCTYYVSQRRTIPWSGNAIAWLSGARAFGYSTGNVPQVGAIVVTSEGGRTGHVAMVDSVNGDQITLTEMNYNGFGVISSRTISASYSRILGYIY